MSTVLVPPSPGATSAAGLLYSDVRVDHIVTHVRTEHELEPGDVAAHLAVVRERALDDLDAQGFEPAGVRLEAFADLRYAGQGYEIRIAMPVADGAVATADVSALIEGFHAAHEDQYGFADRGGEAVELVSIGVTGFGVLRRPALDATDGAGAGEWTPARKYERDMYSRADERTLPVAVYDREHTPRGTALPGPAVVEQYDSTVVVERGWQATTTPYGQLLLTRA
jgi:N-methylhydantoinase A